ncbi:MAG: Bax inhibitor-1/YccA family protein [Magnetococcales bacterium]|nr:Bax inhibitor-1/YccA family protein [Magnetococcales bacterium]NGZ25715.1 Bax inhibitor-1/YccA family protein [Magnetococcales bacterium]
MEQSGHPFGKTAVATGTRGVVLAPEAAQYLKQVYSLLAISLMVAVAGGYVGMSTPFAYEHPIVLIVAQLAVLFLAFSMRNTVTLLLFTAISGFALGPVIAYYLNAGLSHVVGQALFLTGGVFVALSTVAMVSDRDFSTLQGTLFAGLIVVVLGGLVNLFIQSTALSFAMSAVGAVIFSGYILMETQQLKENPWAEAPAYAALSMYLNVLNLFLSLLRLLGIFGSDD